MLNSFIINSLFVSTNYKKNSKILFDNFSYYFSVGKIYFILGRSGVGKTTLISYFNGLKKIKRGWISINDHEMNHKIKQCQLKHIRQHIQLLFQQSNDQIFKNKVLNDVVIGPINFSIKKKQAYYLAKKYLRLVGLKSVDFNSSIFSLSFGNKKKVALAGILSIEPQIFVFDEPFVGLDFNSQENLKKIILNLASNKKIILIISHNSDIALELANEILILHDKKIICHGKPYDVFCNKNAIKLSQVGVPNVIKTIDRLPHEFSFLYKKQPKNVDELANYINQYLFKKIRWKNG